MDEALLRAFPLLAVPASGAQAPAAEYGTRYLAGRHGVSREITLPWVRICRLIAPSALPLPYGVVADAVEFRCGPIPLDVIQQFVAHAKEEQPLEVAGAFLWNERHDSWRYARRTLRSVSAAHLQYQELRPADGEHLVVDAHSHGRHAAFFSAQDDADDAGAMKISLVLGNLDQQRPTSKMRLCMAGLVQPAFLDRDGKLRVPA
ncbi:PRTRC system protein A [Ramlibacter sp. AN1133]|uniref:PRTRC system protein A n=1 Tax=Ramlibacter sp. AN1133 TaxID=3133429 RepID=UPI0030BA87FB